MQEMEIFVHGAEWTTKELFVYPNEFIYWTIQIVMYPYITGLVAGAFVLSSLYHVFGQKDLKDLAKFSLIFSLALIPVIPMPLLLHLQQPTRAFHSLLTPHFTSAISAFGFVLSAYSLIVFSEIWFAYRTFFISQARELKGQPDLGNRIKAFIYRLLTLGSYDTSPRSIAIDRKAVKILAGAGIPVACFLHGYAGFIFGSVKANALWMSPLMPVIFIMSAVVSGTALCMLTYIVVMEWRQYRTRRPGGEGKIKAQEIGGVEMDVIKKASRYLIGFLIAAISLELLDLIFRSYTALKSWEILRSIMYGKDFVNIFILQYGLGNLVPLILLLLPRLSIRRAVVALALILFGVFMMRWNVVIGGQAFSLSFAGYMHYHLPIIPHNWETFKEGLFGALLVGIMPFVFFWLVNKIIPAINYSSTTSSQDA